LCVRQRVSGSKRNEPKAKENWSFGNGVAQYAS
jgi:hypothetical protein